MEEEKKHDIRARGWMLTLNNPMQELKDVI